MIKPRIIPCLLIQNGGLVKTIGFDNPKYIGDPINAVKIFNEKFVDELIVLDIEASIKGENPNLELINALATECRMPLCYGGGIKTVEQIREIIELGVEKVSLSSIAIEKPNIITNGAQFIGSQSIVITLDVKKINDRYFVFTNNGQNNTNLSPIDLALKFQDIGAGEIVINSIDRDGVMNGYDIELIENLYDKINIPITVLGGASNLDDIKLLFKKFGLIGASAGSLFVFKGKFKAVLINYPNDVEKNKLYF